MKEKELTGRKMFLIVVSAFGVIIGVNLVMAYKAISTFPGLVVKNTYVVSQNFNENKAAQLALGWEVSAEISDGNMRLSFLDRAKNPVEPARLETLLGRATNRASDLSPDFVFDGALYTAPVDLAPGNWSLQITAVADNGTSFRQRLVIIVKNQ